MLEIIKMDKTQIEKEFQERFLALRKIVNLWDLIPGSPKDEFDSMIHYIISHLYKGADSEKISRVLNSELTVNYGLTTDNDEIEKQTEEIFDWWNLINRTYEI